MGRHSMWGDDGAQSAVTLTSREHEVVQLLTQGMSNAQIARLMSISRRTVRFHLCNVFLKLLGHLRGRVSGRVLFLDPKNLPVGKICVDGCRLKVKEVLRAPRGIGKRKHPTVRGSVTMREEIQPLHSKRTQGVLRQLSLGGRASVLA